MKIVRRAISSLESVVVVYSLVDKSKALATNKILFLTKLDSILNKRIEVWFMAHQFNANASILSLINQYNASRAIIVGVNSVTNDDNIVISQSAIMSISMNEDTERNVSILTMDATWKHLTIFGLSSTASATVGFYLYDDKISYISDANTDNTWVAIPEMLKVTQLNLTINPSKFYYRNVLIQALSANYIPSFDSIKYESRNSIKNLIFSLPMDEGFGTVLHSEIGSDIIVPLSSTDDFILWVYPDETIITCPSSYYFSYALKTCIKQTLAHAKALIDTSTLTSCMPDGTPYGCEGNHLSCTRKFMVSFWAYHTIVNTLINLFMLQYSYLNDYPTNTTNLILTIKFDGTTFAIDIPPRMAVAVGITNQAILSLQGDPKWLHYSVIVDESKATDTEKYKLFLNTFAVVLNFASYTDSNAFPLYSNKSSIMIMKVSDNVAYSDIFISTNILSPLLFNTTLVNSLTPFIGFYLSCKYALDNMVYVQYNKEEEINGETWVKESLIPITIENQEEHLTEGVTERIKIM